MKLGSSNSLLKVKFEKLDTATSLGTEILETILLRAVAKDAKENNEEQKARVKRRFKRISR